MKKLLSVSIMAMLAVSPMMAHAADPVSNTHGPTHSETANSAASGVVAPFASESITTDDQAGIASAAYVKGAYNAAIRAVNTVAADVASMSEDLDDTITSKINDAAGTGLTANNGVLSVNTATTVADNGTGYVTSDLLYDQGYQNATQVTDSIKSAAGTGLTAANDGTLSVNTANAVADGNTNYVTSDLLHDQGYQNSTQVGNAISGAITALDLANTYDAKGAADDVQTAIEGKLDDGANGYDVDFKTAKIQGTSIATKADVNSAINGSSVSSSGTINLYNAWGATTTTPVTVNTTGTVSKAAYVEP